MYLATKQPLVMKQDNHNNVNRGLRVSIFTWLWPGFCLAGFPERQCPESCEYTYRMTVRIA